MVKQIAFVAYSVKDVPRAVAFYRDLIGLKQAESFGDKWVEFDVGDTTFGVGDGTAIGAPPGSAQLNAAFEVDDVVAMRKRLKDAGVPVSDVNDSPVCFSCWVTDPDGNRFALHQSKPR